RLSRLADRPGGEDLRAPLVRALARLARRRPDRAEALLDEIAARLARSPEGRLPALLAQARAYRVAGRPDRAAAILARALEDPEAAGERRGPLHLERARAFAALGRAADALEALDRADEFLDSADARLLRAALLAIQGRELDRAAALAEAAEVGPLSRFVLARLRGDPALARSALAALDDASPLEDLGLPFDALYRPLLEAATDPGVAADLARHARRLFPEAAEYALDLARALRRAGRAAEAADAYEAAGALDQAAEACLEGGLWTRAAELYRALYAQGPSRNREALLGRAEALRRAGRLEEALAALAELLAASPPRHALGRRALLERGRILAGAGRTAEALREFERLRTDPSVGAEPRDPEWAGALFESARLTLDRRLLAEYLERYGETGAFPREAMEAAWLLARVALREGDAPAALGALDRMEALGPRAPDAPRLKQARFLRGEVLAALGRWEEAERAFDAAYRNHLDDAGRFQALAGRARALARLDRREEARRALETARELFTAAPAGLYGRFWTGTLDALAGELR
ncbi:MAG TPA: tetratricopeptide repeat protein, partial [Planctomycetota bacterium]|nr:tetratricopeptide repeat protein [Planctomycetota bacterium]